MEEKRKEESRSGEKDICTCTCCGGVKAKTANTNLTRSLYFLTASIAYFASCKLDVCSSYTSILLYHQRISRRSSIIFIIILPVSLLVTTITITIIRLCLLLLLLLLGHCYPLFDLSGYRACAQKTSLFFSYC